MRIETFRGILFYIGENARDNHELFDKMDDNAIWVHLEDYPSAHVYFEIPKDKTVKKSKLLKIAGRIIKQNSKYQHIKNLEICYTRKHNLKKSDKLGEVIINGDIGIMKI